MNAEYEDPRRTEQLSHRMKKVAYPPRLMVDFTSLGVRSSCVVPSLPLVSILTHPL